MRNAQPERRRREGRRKKRLTILPFCVIQSFQIVLVVKSFYWTKSYISSAVLHLHLVINIDIIFSKKNLSP